MHQSSRFARPRTLLLAAAVAAASQAQASTLHEIIVTADLRDTSAMRLPASVSVLGGETINRRAAQHMEDVLNVAPNVNFAAGASRGRFVQIRGIGERGQFADPVNPSVGLVIDGIDFSGIGNAGLLHDIGQVEVLRGPQGTRFGANGMAGLLVLVSEQPTDEFEGSVTGEYANYDSWRLGGVVSGPMADNLNGRLSVSQYRSDGFQRNAFLDRRDTADYDEFAARARFDWQVSDLVNLDLTVMHVDVDNGYDGFSLDNTRTTLSDEPGRDQQRTTAAALKGSWLAEPVTLEATVTWEQTDTLYSFDEDWGYVGICAGLPCENPPEPWLGEYSSTDRYQRDRDSHSLDLRLLSNESSRLFGTTDWLVGAYVHRLDEDMRRDFVDWNATEEEITLSTQWQADRYALYAQTDTALTDSLTLSVGGRWERWEADYRDNMGVAAQPTENLWGGQVSLEYRLAEDRMVYGLVSRGYKPAGVNGAVVGFTARADLDPADEAFLQGSLNYDTETLLNYEIGFKGRFADDRLLLTASAFHMDRKDIQVRNWYNVNQLFVEFLDNSTRGSNTGVEIETQWLATDRLTLFANLGLLETRTRSFEVHDVDLDELVERGSRDQAHAPNYQFYTGFQYDWDDWFVRFEFEGKDSFYFSDSHNARSSSYELLHAQLGYRQGPLQLTLWTRNLTGKDYPTRGFYFGNDPRKGYVNETYNQFGEPRRVGLTATYSF